MREVGRGRAGGAADVEGEVRAGAGVSAAHGFGVPPLSYRTWAGTGGAARGVEPDADGLSLRARRGGRRCRASARGVSSRRRSIASTPGSFAGAASLRGRHHVLARRRGCEAAPCPPLRRARGGSVAVAAARAIVRRARTRSPGRSESFWKSRRRSSSASTICNGARRRSWSSSNPRRSFPRGRRCCCCAWRGRSCSSGARPGRRR